MIKNKKRWGICSAIVIAAILATGCREKKTQESAGVIVGTSGSEATVTGKMTTAPTSASTSVPSTTAQAVTENSTAVAQSSAMATTVAKKTTKVASETGKMVTGEQESSQKFVPAQAPEEKTPYFVTGDAQNYPLYQSADKKSKVIANVPVFSVVQVTTDTNGMKKVQYLDKTGYMTKENISTQVPKEIENIGEEAVAQTNIDVAMREGASEDAAQITTMPKDSPVLVLKKVDGYALVNYLEYIGYVPESSVKAMQE